MPLTNQKEKIASYVRNFSKVPSNMTSMMEDIQQQNRKKKFVNVFNRVTVPDRCRLALLLLMLCSDLDPFTVMLRSL